MENHSTSTIKSLYENEGDFPLDFNVVINTFYEENYDYTNHPYDKTVNDIEVISADVDRSFSFIKTKKTQQKYQTYLNTIINKLHVTYYQGMSDILSLIIYYYIKICGEDFNESEEKILKVSTKILVSKILPLVINDFFLYKHYNKIFLKILEEGGEIAVDDQNAFIFMKYGLTFFTRLCYSLSDMYIMFSLILSTPLNCPFVLLLRFHDIIKKKKKITFSSTRARNVEKIDLEGEDFLLEIIQLEKKFLKMEDKMEQPDITVNKGRLGYVVGGALVIGIGIALAYFTKRD